MPTIIVQGKRVNVSDAFMSLSPEEQQQTVEEIARSFGEEARVLDPPIQSQAPEYVPPGVEGYNPDTGMVQRNSAPYSALQGATDAASFGFADEAAAGLGSLLDNILPGGQSRSYDEALAGIRGQQESAQQDNPWSYLGGQIGGGVAMGAATGAPLAAASPSLVMRSLGSAATGAAGGGLYGFGSGEGLEDRAVEGAVGAGVGGALGALFPAVAEVGRRGYRAVADALTTNRTASGVGTSPDVLRILSRQMGADDTLGPRGLRNMAAAGQDAMLVDAGPNAKTILDATIQRGGRGGVIARDAVEARTGRAGHALTDALDNTLGQPQGVTAARTAIRQGSAGARGTAYDAAYATPIDYASQQGQTLERMIRRRVTPDIIATANKIMRLDDDTSQQILARVADDGSVAFEVLPDVRQIDYITRALNQASQSGEGQGALGGQTTLGTAYQNLSRDIRNNLRTLVPEYGNALETAADPIRRSQAVDLGSRLLSPGMTRDQVAEAVDGMTRPERDAVAQGVRSRIDDMMANVKRTLLDDNTDAREAIKGIAELSSRANREKLGTVIGQQRADQLFDEIDRVATSFNLRARVAANSATYSRLALDRDVKTMTEPGVIGLLAQGKPVQAPQRMMQEITAQTPRHQLAAQDEIFSELARLLVSPGSQDLFNAVGTVGRQSAASQLMSDRIARALMAGPYPATLQLQEPANRWIGNR